MERPRAPSRVRTSRAYRNPHTIRITYLIIPLFYYNIQLHITDTQERRDGHPMIASCHTSFDDSTAALYTVSFSRACVRPCFSYSVRSGPHTS
jgi:hypothetical protein